MTDARAEQPKRWRGWVQNLLLVFGISYVYGLAWMAASMLAGAAVSGRTFSDTAGVFPWSAFKLRAITSLLPASVASAFAGYVAGLYLQFARAGWAVLVLAALSAITNYSSGQWFREPEAWERTVEIVEAVLIAVLMPAVFLLTRRIESLMKRRLPGT